MPSNGDTGSPVPDGMFDVDVATVEPLIKYDMTFAVSDAATATTTTR
jgi:hypothetical protein